ncbi:conserved hypothetical protein [Culex quinquefasciatus]|uniref:Uncharacterized protein n=1 Tax=Culex quinquefasciatus TaxID=7176 RepID=B0WWB6_CULQU|nr:conserved hypothetical protein [Culex quinquefasciatus]|eukprot:XP_001861688.1 conserved hypothetical protein [Culex quinquefasciatus]
MKCYVPSCQTDFHHLPEGISKHKFPTDEDRQLEWIIISHWFSIKETASIVDPSSVPPDDWPAEVSLIVFSCGENRLTSLHFLFHNLNSIMAGAVVWSSALLCIPADWTAGLMHRMAGVLAGDQAGFCPGSNLRVPQLVAVGLPMGQGQVALHMNIIHHYPDQHRVSQPVVVSLPVGSRQVAPQQRQAINIYTQPAVFPSTCRLPRPGQMTTQMNPHSQPIQHRVLQPAVVGQPAGPIQQVPQHYGVVGQPAGPIQRVPQHYGIVGQPAGPTQQVPVGYFLINGISAEAKMDLVNTMLIALHDAGVTIRALVFDGTQANLSMAHLLGCNLKIDFEKPLVIKFEHPCSEHSVHVLLDVMHMLKLVRNTCYGRKVIKTPRGEAKWEFLEKLNEFQIENGAKLGNKLSNNHIHFSNNKMKTIYAIQTISNGCAHALEVLKVFKDEFLSCDATIELLRIFTNLFDIFNSMSPNPSRGK